MTEPHHYSGEHRQTDLSSSPPGGNAPVRASWKGYDYPSTAIVESVSRATGREETALPPLYEAVDPDALDALLVDETDGLRLSFRYAGTTVSVGADHVIRIRTGSEAN